MQAIATVKEKGSASVKGTVRKVNEDVYHIVEDAPFAHYTAVFDGHGGVATASWLKENFVPYVEDAWNPSNPKSSLLEACLAADREILSVSTCVCQECDPGLSSQLSSRNPVKISHRRDACHVKRHDTPNAP